MIVIMYDLPAWTGKANRGLRTSRAWATKAWAYKTKGVGICSFGITVLSTCYSHYNAGDGWLALEPLVTFAALMISYGHALQIEHF